METKVYAIPLQGTDKVLRMEVKQFEDDDNIQIEQLLKINFTRIKAEALTFPVILNRLGLLVADAERVVKEKQLEFEVWEAKTKGEIREGLRERKRAEKLTDDDIKSMLYMELYGRPTYAVKKRQIINAEHNYEVVKAFFWNAKDKSEKINVLLDKAQPDDIQLEELVGEINGIKLSAKDKVMK